MNKRMVFSTLGQLTLSEAILMILPLITALIYGEIRTAIAFAITVGIALLIGGVLYFCFSTDNKLIFAKEGFVIVAFGWLIMSAIGALPFVISGDIPSYIDAFFETVSGFTTTGASILTDIEAMSHGCLFWRSFTHWVGGMGVLVFVMALIPSISDRSIHIMRAEMPGPIVGKIVPRARATARILYVIYFVMTLVQIVLLLLGGMDLFESLIHSFGTAGTGGFGMKGDSIASYSPYLQWVITVFMFLFGVNFNIYFLILMKDIETALKSEELKAYILIYIFAVAFIVLNTFTMFDTFNEAFRQGAFHVASIMTSTGYSVGDINIYPASCRILFLVLMIVSACAGSTCGGFKISRLLICMKSIKRDILKTFHPNSVRTITFEGKKVEEDTVKSTTSFLLLYIGMILLLMFLISFDGFTLDQTMNAVFTTFGNVGLCFDISNFSLFSNFSKVVLSIGMLFGRLEIFPIIVWASSIKR